MTKNIFKEATRNKLRFESDRGLLTTEQLYDLKLTDLDKIARGVSKKIKSHEEEESFIERTVHAETYSLTLMLDILKDVISDKLDYEQSVKERNEKANKRKILLDALASKENEEITKMSKDEILAELESL